MVLLQALSPLAIFIISIVLTAFLYKKSQNMMEQANALFYPLAIAGFAVALTFTLNMPGINQLAEAEPSTIDRLFFTIYALFPIIAITITFYCKIMVIDRMVDKRQKELDSERWGTNKTD